MDNNKNNNFTDTMKQIFSLKRTKATLYAVAVLWLAVVTQMVVNRVFQEEFKITQAFIKTNTEEMESGLEVIAEYKKEFLSEQDKKNLIVQLADSIGLNIDEEIKVTKEGHRSEYSYQKRAKSATSEIKFISIEQEVNDIVVMKHYITVRLNIIQSVESIDKYKNTIIRTLENLGVTDKQVTLYYTGVFDGKLTKREMNEIASFMIDELQGTSALEYYENDLYTVYAYTGLINEYVVSAGCKVNIQIAFTYNEVNDKTKVYLATPILNQSW